MNNITLDTWSACKAILTNPSAKIPPVPENDLTKEELDIKRRLARLSNGPTHTTARQAAQDLFWSRQRPPVPPLLERLLHNAPDSFDWVDTISRPLPILYVLKCFGFSNEDCDVFTHHMPALLRLMQGLSPGKEWSDLYPRLQRQISRIETGADSETQLWQLSNFIGLMIQSYDATRGLLNNVLFHLLQQQQLDNARDKDFCKKFVLEVIRYDSPVLFTRRITNDDLITVHLAAANRDPQQFANPNQFDIHRPNNREALSFGYGLHACLANIFCIELATEVLYYLGHRYQDIRIMEADIEYEPIPNLRLIRHLSILIHQKHRPQ